jgi:CheY-like chemotaxis protein
MKTIAVRRVCIPVNASDSSPEASRMTTAPAVLVALDDADLRSVSTRVLENAGYRVVTARHSGHALLACLTAGRIDVLLTDLRMADGSGPALAERLRRHNPDLRSVFFSEDRTDAATDVLVRPVTADALLSALTAGRAA